MYSVGKFEDLGHIVADKDNRQAPLPHIEDEFQNAFGRPFVRAYNAQARKD